MSLIKQQIKDNWRPVCAYCCSVRKRPDCFVERADVQDDGKFGITVVTYCHGKVYQKGFSPWAMAEADKKEGLETLMPVAFEPKQEAPEEQVPQIWYPKYPVWIDEPVKAPKVSNNSFGEVAAWAFQNLPPVPGIQDYQKEILKAIGIPNDIDLTPKAKKPKVKKEAPPPPVAAPIPFGPRPRKIITQ